MMLLLLPKMAGKGSNKKIKQIISIISLLQILKKVTTLGSAAPERCLFVRPP